MEINGERIVDRLFLSRCEMNRVRQIFTRWSVSDKGMIFHTSFAASIRKLDPTLSDEAVDMLFAEADRNKDGVVDYDEFVDWVFMEPLDKADTSAVMAADGNQSAKPAPMGSQPPDVVKESVEAEHEQVASDAQVASGIARLSLTVVNMVGQTWEVGCFTEDHPFSALRLWIEKEMAASQIHRVTVVMGTERFAEKQDKQTLKELGIGTGCELLAVLRQALFDIDATMTIEVRSAGTCALDGIYSAKHYAGDRAVGYDARYFFEQSSGGHAIRWYTSANGWPSGWYFEWNERGGAFRKAYYFQPSYVQTCLPLDGWEIYNGEMSAPDAQEPGPSIVLLEQSDDVQNST